MSKAKQKVLHFHPAKAEKVLFLEKLPISIAGVSNMSKAKQKVLHFHPAKAEKVLFMVNNRRQ